MCPHALFLQAQSHITVHKFNQGSKKQKVEKQGRSLYILNTIAITELNVH